MYLNENKNLLLRIIGLVIVIAVIATIATAIGAVSAADFYVSPDGDDSHSGDSTNPWGNISHALDQISPDGDTIYLKNGTHTAGFNGNGIAINKNVTFIGVPGDNGENVTLDAGKAARHFNINGPYTVKFQNIQFINGAVSGSGNDKYGGAIFINGGNVTIASSTFTNNTASTSSYAYGGAIYIEGGSVTIGNSNFTNNQASYGGGAIYISGATVNITGSTFTNNQVPSGYGGAINIVNDANVNITNSTFTNNNVRFGGGAIYIEGGSITIDNSTFTNSASNYEAGAIYIRNGANVNITGSTFTSNKANNGNGGAIYIYWTTSKVNIANSTFTNNRASTNGGAIYISSGNVNISYSRIYNNTGYQVYRDGGNVTADYNWWGNNTPIQGRDYEGTITIDNYFMVDATFDGVNLTYRFYLNTRQDIDGSDLPVFDATISRAENIVDTIDARVSQTYTPIADDNIYTLSVDGYSMTFQRYDVLYVDPDNGDDSYAGTSTGTALATIAKALDLINAGGTIYLMEGTYNEGFPTTGIAITTDVNIIGYSGTVTLDAAKASRHFNINGAYTVKFENIVFINGTSDSHGGAIYINNGGAVEIVYCTFINNTVSYGGGAIRIDQGDLTIRDCTFINNTARDGGAIYIVNGNISNCTFINNDAARDGGAIYINGNFNISNCTFINNTASSSAGGAIFISGDGSVNISNSTFINNTASVVGGAIYIYIYGTVNISNSRIYNNSPTQVYRSMGTVIADYNWWGNNKPTYPRDYNDFTITNYFVANATFDGTDLNYRFYLNTSQEVDESALPSFNMSITNSSGDSVFSRDARMSQTYTPDANGIYTLSVDGYTMTFGRYDVLYVSPDGDDDTNVGNTTANPLRTIAVALERIRNGGTVYLMDGTHNEGFPTTGIAITKNVTFIGVVGANVVLDARKGGRHFNITGPHTVKFENIQLVNGHASGTENDRHGGSIFINNPNPNAKVEIAYCTFINNTASATGGAIGIYNGNVSISNSTFINNTASYGGAIYINGGSLNISYSRIYNNSATQVRVYGENVIANYNWWGNNTPTEGTDYNSGVTVNNHFMVDPTFDGTNLNYRFYLNTSQEGGSSLPTFNMSITNESGDIVYSVDARVSQTYTPNANGIYTLSVDDYTFEFKRYDVLYVSPGGIDTNVGNTTVAPLQTIAAALTKICNGGTIYLMEGTHTDGFTTTGIAITKNINIIGLDGANVILDADKSGRHFNITGANTVKFKNIQFINGTATGSGNDGYGGAIFINNANAIVEITNVTFTNNTADSGSDGGAIFIISGNVNISNSTFTSNTAFSGGAIFIISGNVNISNSTFTNNNAIMGGAININNANVNITNSTFTNNGYSETQSYAGAINIENGNVNISNCTFTNNTATDGGAIHIANGNVNISNCTFTNNTASYGGAIRISYSSGVVNISYCRIYNNTASQVHVYDGTVIANYNWWGNNTPTSPRDYTVAGGTMTIDNCFMANATFDGTDLNYRFYLNTSQDTDGSDLPVFDATISLGGNIVETGDARVSQRFTPSVSGDYTLSVDDYSLEFEAIVIPLSDMSVSLSTGGKKVLKVGDTFNLLVTVTNLGPSKSSFVLTIEIPKGMKFVSAKATHGTVTYKDGAVYWDVSNLEPKYADVLLNPAGDLAPYQALLDITLKVLKSGKFAFKYNVEGINTVVNLKGDTKIDLIAIKKNGTNNNDINKNKINKINKTKYKHANSGMMKTGVQVPIDSPVPTPIPVPTNSPVPIVIIVLIAILALIAMFFIVIGLRRRN